MKIAFVLIAAMTIGLYSCSPKIAESTSTAASSSSSSINNSQNEVVQTAAASGNTEVPKNANIKIENNKKEAATIVGH